MFNVPKQVRNYNGKDESIFIYLTYRGFSNSALAQFIEVNEELLNTNSILEDERLDSALNVVFALQSGWCLVVTLVAMLALSHELDLVAHCSHFI